MKKKVKKSIKKNKTVKKALPVLNPEKKIYLAFTVLGDRAKLDLVDSLARMLHQRGYKILTTHLLSKNVLDEEALNPAEFVFERDKNWLDECDFFIAEVSGSGMGVGFEIGYLAAKGKKVYVLYDKTVEQKVSRMIRGNTMENCIRVPYENIQDVYQFIENNF